MGKYKTENLNTSRLRQQDKNTKGNTIERN